MSEDGKKKSKSVFPKAQDDILKYFVLSTTQRYEFYCHRGGKKQEHFDV